MKGFLARDEIIVSTGKYERSCRFSLQRHTYLRFPELSKFIRSTLTTSDMIRQVKMIQSLTICVYRCNSYLQMGMSHYISDYQSDPSSFTAKNMVQIGPSPLRCRYPLVNVYIAMENHHLQYINIHKSTSHVKFPEGQSHKITLNHHLPMVFLWLNYLIIIRFSYGFSSVSDRCSPRTQRESDASLGSISR